MSKRWRLLSQLHLYDLSGLMLAPRAKKESVYLTKELMLARIGHIDGKALKVSYKSRRQHIRWRHK